MIDLLYGVRMWAEDYIILSMCTHLTDGRTDGRTDIKATTIA